MNGQKLKLGDAHAPQEISKRYKHQSLGMPPRHPFFIGKNQVTFEHTIFFMLHALCIFLGVSLLLLSVLFFLFAAINGWTPKNLFWRRFTCFSFAKNTLFSLLSFNECSLFLELHLGFVFRLDFCSDLVISLYQGIFGPLVYVGIHQKSCLKKVQMVLEKRIIFMQKKGGTKRSLFRLRLKIFHAMLDIVLIVCLVIFAVA
jgi:hypothetical protein